jgi:hypothetical protein
VAGSSVESFFGQYCVDPAGIYSFEDAQEMQISSFGILGSRLVKNKKWYNHMSAGQIRTHLGAEKFNAYYKFCVVRNPYDVLVSAYFYSRSKRDFKTFCKRYKNHFAENNGPRLFLDGAPVCQYYIRYENLLEDMKVVLAALGITNYDLDKLPRHKSSTRVDKRPYQDYYDDETRALVYELFRAEFDMFGYTF